MYTSSHEGSREEDEGRRRREEERSRREREEERGGTREGVEKGSNKKPPRPCPNLRNPFLFAIISQGSQVDIELRLK